MSCRHLVLWLMTLSCLLPGGCVRRRMTIRSTPPGATVYVDDQEIGETPVSTSFVYYGTRKIQLVKDGYETLTVQHKFAPPWYQIPPLDFFSENLSPYEYRDERIVELEMEPQRVVPVPELLERAGQLRQATRAGYTLAPPIGGVPTPMESRNGAGLTSPPPDARPSILPPPFP